jgi:AraC-like DNA-binding protein
MSVQLHFYDGLALAFSRGHSSNPHAHLALQLTLGLEREFEVQLPDAQGHLCSHWVRFACFPPEQAHFIPAADIELAYLYLEQNPTSFDAWRAAGGTPREPEPGLRAALLEFRRNGFKDRHRAYELAQQWRAQSLPGLIRIAPSDPRIATVVDYLDAHPLEPHTHVTLARRVHLSPSRFAHLFRDQLGLPVRNYLLWRRLVYALSRLQQGQSITTAAYESGFSDGAHLCRSFRSVFGAMPTDLHVERLQVASNLRVTAAAR